MCAQLNAYPCHYCGKYFCPDYDNVKKVRNEFDGELEDILVCDHCCSILAGEIDRRNTEQFTTLIMRMGE
jgi:phage terminase large subunit GpA-like protein